MWFEAPFWSAISASLLPADTNMTKDTSYSVTCHTFQHFFSLIKFKENAFDVLLKVPSFGWNNRPVLLCQMLDQPLNYFDLSSAKQKKDAFKVELSSICKKSEKNNYK